MSTTYAYETIALYGSNQASTEDWLAITGGESVVAFDVPTATADFRLTIPDFRNLTVHRTETSRETLDDIGAFVEASHRLLERNDI